MDGMSLFELAQQSLIFFPIGGFLQLLAPIAASLVGSALGGSKKKYNPMEDIVPGLMDIGGGILGGIMGGKGKKDEIQQQYEEKYKYDQKTADAKLARAEAAGFKPKSERYETFKDFGTFDQMLKGLAGGMLEQWGSGKGNKKGKAGLDVSGLMAMLQGGSGGGGSAPIASATGAKGNQVRGGYGSSASPRRKSRGGGDDEEYMI